MYFCTSKLGPTKALCICLTQSIHDLWCLMYANNTVNLKANSHQILQFSYWPYTYPVTTMIFHLQSLVITACYPAYLRFLSLRWSHLQDYHLQIVIMVTDGLPSNRLMNHKCSVFALILMFSRSTMFLSMISKDARSPISLIITILTSPKPATISPCQNQSIITSALCHRVGVYSWSRSTTIATYHFSSPRIILPLLFLSCRLDSYCGSSNQTSDNTFNILYFCVLLRTLTPALLCYKHGRGFWDLCWKMTLHLSLDHNHN